MEQGWPPVRTDRRRQRMSDHRACWSAGRAGCGVVGRGGEGCDNPGSGEPPGRQTAAQAIRLAADRRNSPGTHGLSLRRPKGRWPPGCGSSPPAGSRFDQPPPRASPSQVAFQIFARAGLCQRASTADENEKGFTPAESVAAVTPSDSGNLCSRSHRPVSSRSTAAVLPLGGGKHPSDILPPRRAPLRRDPCGRSESPAALPMFVSLSLIPLSRGNRPLARCPNQLWGGDHVIAFSSIFCVFPAWRTAFAIKLSSLRLPIKAVRVRFQRSCLRLSSFSRNSRLSVWKTFLFVLLGRDSNIRLGMFLSRNLSIRRHKTGRPKNANRIAVS